MIGPKHLIRILNVGLGRVPESKREKRRRAATGPGRRGAWHVLELDS